MLLDISNNDEYVWTTSSNPSSSSTITSSPSNVVSTTAIGTSIGVIGGIALTIGSFFLYKRYKNRKERNEAIPTPGNEGGNNYPKEILTQKPPSQVQLVDNHGQETIPISGNMGSLAQIQQIDNHGQEAIPISGNTGSLAQQNQT